MQNCILVDIPKVAYCDIENDCVFLIHISTIKDSDIELEKIWPFVKGMTKVEDVTSDNRYYIGGKVRLRRWIL